MELCQQVSFNCELYCLRIVVLHSGTENIGHYWAVVRHFANGEDSWWLYNDSIRKRVSDPANGTSAAGSGRTYMLFYCRSGLPHMDCIVSTSSSSTAENNIGASDHIQTGAGQAHADTPQKASEVSTSAGLEDISAGTGQPQGDGASKEEPDKTHSSTAPTRTGLLAMRQSRVLRANAKPDLTTQRHVQTAVQSGAAQAHAGTPQKASVVSTSTGVEDINTGTGQPQGDPIQDKTPSSTVPIHINPVLLTLDLSTAHTNIGASAHIQVGAAQAHADSPQKANEVSSSIGVESEFGAISLLAQMGMLVPGYEVPVVGNENSLAEDNESNVSGDTDASDVEDVFMVAAREDTSLSMNYKKCFLFRWSLAVTALSKQLRSNVLLPQNPSSTNDEETWADVHQAVVLPIWHCAFKGCTTCAESASCEGNHELELWQHIWHSGTHKSQLMALIQEHSLQEPYLSTQEIALTLYNEALAEQERKSMPLLGIATDRRNLRHIGEVFLEDNVQTLICFICGCKHIAHAGFDKFGKKQQKGDISFRTDVGRILQQILEGDARKPDSIAEESWRYNLSRKYYKARFGNAVATDPHLADHVREWKRSVFRNGRSDDILCCPEDVVMGKHCRHSEERVCSKCSIPICNECYNKAANGKKNPKTLANDNFIGYAHAFLIEHRVTWLEATIAGPVFSGLVTYYIEGDASQRHHLMEATVGQPERAYAVRGNIFFFLLPWENAMKQLSQKIERGDLSEWPLSSEEACKLVRVRFVRGPEQILNKFKALHVRSWVIKRLARIYIARNIEDLGNRPEVLKLHTLHKCTTIQEASV